MTLNDCIKFLNKILHCKLWTDVDGAGGNFSKVPWSSLIVDYSSDMELAKIRGLDAQIFALNIVGHLHVI